MNDARPAAPAPAADLPARLRDRIRRHGSVSFAEFMEAALYDPEGGFYRRVRVGTGGDFVTSPHVSEAFGALLAVQVAEWFEALGRPDPFTVVELGAGDGELARQLLASLPGQAVARARYLAVERSPALREAIRAGGLPAVTVLGSLDEVPAPVTGVVLANEVLDNVPFHRVRRTDRGLVELRVGLADDRFVLVESPPPPELVACAPPLEVGEEAVVMLQGLELFDRALSLLRRGYLLLVDYGWAGPGGRRDLVHGYRGHRAEEDVLSEPGSRDITAGVDFGALAARAAARGLPVWGPLPQREALLALGFRDWQRRARRRQLRALDRGRSLEAVRAYAGRSRANLLLDPGGLGGFLVLCVGVGVDPAVAPRLARPPEAGEDRQGWEGS
ncbi:MAG TPA: SAM-dependent methyltransferase [Actinomycetota bacterium]|nr:SAM-dependent methyltransferase [Actinomycetota bacterium]